MSIQPLSPSSLLAELRRLTEWWIRHSVDGLNGGFFGAIDSQNIAQADANKGIVLNCRLLWFFSRVARFMRALPDGQYHSTATQCAAMADRAYDYLRRHFRDQVHGGVFWELRAQGHVENQAKQSYAQCFYIYAVCAYFELVQRPLVLHEAISTFELLEQHALDRNHGGYIESLVRDWQPQTQQRLSDKDMVADKSMNTQLHVLEAYTQLQKISGSHDVAKALERCAHSFQAHIINAEQNCLGMFFSADWQDLSTHRSYGHDVEASWLFHETANVLSSNGHRLLGEQFRQSAIMLAEHSIDHGRNNDGFVIDEQSLCSNNSGADTNTDSVWWVQAEAMVGYLWAYRITTKPGYREAAEEIWAHIQRQHIDHEYGEWHWFAHSQQPQPYKAGFWKGPYHNGRALIQCHELLIPTNASLAHAK